MNPRSNTDNCDRVRDFLYVGGDYAVLPAGTTDVVSIGPNYGRKVDPAIHQHHFELEDDTRENILSIVDDAVDLIENIRRRNGRVYLHCAVGQSRSPSIAMAYIMKYEKKTLKEAHREVSACREIWPNPGFLEDLAAWEHELG